MAIEQMSRQALSELKRLLGLLRPDDPTAVTAPPPTLDELPRLVQKMRDAGLCVELRIVGNLVPLSPGIELTAFRIAQESLTNVLKHAAGSRAEVLVHFRDAELEIEVRDTGNGGQARGRGEGLGHGIHGMGERVALYGGQVVAGPLDNGGFSVRARLPLRENQQ